FFLQAEDGIRDFHVTGVQTCALPISAVKESQMARTKAVFLFIFTVATFPGLAQERDHAFEVNNRLGRGINMGNSFEAPTETAWRSEERRVGREGGCRRSADYKTNQDT